MRNILRMGKRQLRDLDPEEINRPLVVEEYRYIVKTLGRGWLNSPNIKRAMALQIVMRLLMKNAILPDCVTAVSDEVMELGQELALILSLASTRSAEYSSEYLDLEEFVDHAWSTKQLKPDDNILIIGNVCEDGRDFVRIVMSIKLACPCTILPYYPVMENRSSIFSIGIEGSGGPFVLLHPAVKRKFLRDDLARAFALFVRSVQSRLSES